MTLRSAPIFKVEDAPDVIDDLAQWVRLLRVDPDNPAADNCDNRFAG